jgi:hypothetical protein
MRVAKTAVAGPLRLAAGREWTMNLDGTWHEDSRERSKEDGRIERASQREHEGLSGPRLLLSPMDR